jgi:hypothetical protein
MTRRPLRILTAIVAIAFLAVATARGRIGETEAQIQKRYGDAVTTLPSRTSGAGLTKCYAARGYLVAVTYLHGRSAREMIVKADNSKMTDAEIYRLLGTNGNDASAETQALTGPKSVTVGVTEWRSLDQRSRVAFYDSHTRALFITTQKFIDLTNAQKRAVTLRGDAGGLGARGRSDVNLKAMQRDLGVAAMRGQAKPAATPAK